MGEGWIRGRSQVGGIAFVRKNFEWSGGNHWKGRERKSKERRELERICRVRWKIISTSHTHIYRYIYMK